MIVLKKYYELTKPGVLYGNAITTVAGFLLASKGDINIGLLFAATAGSTFVIASACVVNNYLDQDIDKLMSRTKNRPLVSGVIKPRNALVFGVGLGLLGILVLALYTHWLVVVIGIVGFIDYVFLYGALSKRRSMHGTLVGSISGAIPILAGYVAAAGGFDLGAWLAFAVLFFWQMPEFYSIAIYRRKEYKAAGVPVISVVKGVEVTKRHILAYTILFMTAVLALPAFGFVGFSYLAIMAFLGGYWLNHGIKGFSATDTEAWARKMFRISLIVLLAFSFMISVDAWLP